MTVHEKYLCLFHKDVKQLKKEMNRRGLVYKTKEHAIANILWKDGYDVGFDKGKITKSSVSEEEVFDYIISMNGEDYCVKLTKSQIRLLNWLDSNGMFDAEFFVEEHRHNIGTI